MRQEINDAYDKLEKNTIAKLELLRKRLSHSIQIDISECLKHTDELKSLSNVVLEIGQKDESLAFKAHQKCCKKLSALNELVKDLREVREYLMKMHIRQYIIHLVSSLSSVGELAQYNPNKIIKTSSNATTITPKVQKDPNECSIR
ncbi:hypothetical protein DPMN_170121 [Dreissena polymorpha]|uniref:Uncharacterized protein n=1 Tax=Dreissena polymorpha TaxID=45954 RepID=A0A9D4ICX2_DREPO|nr:hypothetical protein DPMN_170121 [Dreissena polymorpha]